MISISKSFQSLNLQTHVSSPVLKENCLLFYAWGGGGKGRERETERKIEMDLKYWDFFAIFLLNLHFKIEGMDLTKNWHL